MNILADLCFEEIQQLVKEFSQPSFRAKQLYDLVCSGKELNEATNLPKSLVKDLEEKGYTAQGVSIEQVFRSNIDGTEKFLYRLRDGNIIEGVLMKYKYGNTLCVSTQVGCAMGCKFCASTLGGLVRNLSAGEILSQVSVVNAYASTEEKRGVTNIVLMGSGEPLDNYDNVTKFLSLVADEKGLNISKRNVSLSTCGLCDNIRKLADDGFSPVLTISLHAPDDALRKTIMPIANRYSIAQLMSAVSYYFEKTGRRIIFEYSMINGVNDSEECAQKLSALLKGLSCHVNLIRLNYVKERGLKSADDRAIDKFCKILDNHNVSHTIRRSMGSDIEGACGQLRRKYIGDNT